MEITQKKVSEKSDNDSVGSLNAFIQKAKSNAANDKFDKYFNSNIVIFWYYQYTESFHCKPDTIDDMMNGLRYLYFIKAEQA